MLSLSNVLIQRECKILYPKYQNYLNVKNKQFEFSSELKIDGISASLIYENGVLTRGLSRVTELQVRISWQI